jgi:hypothetical protein
MPPSKSLRQIVISCLVGWMLLLLGASAWAQNDDIQLVPEEAPPPAPAEIEIRGMHCTPDVKEVETRRPIPFSCTVDFPAAGVELRYRMEGGSKTWEKIELEQSDTGYTGTIPCTGTGKRGTLKFYLFARNENNKVIARVGRHENPLSIHVMEHSNAPPPALPGQAAPTRCYEQNECPTELRGTPACPGTHAVKTKKGWGASCAASEECQTGMECTKGSCETPAKCEDDKECGEGGECNDGVCHTPTKEELKERLGPPKHHWIGIHGGIDFYLMSAAKGVCGTTSSDSQHFDCFDGGNEYTGTPNVNYAGTVKPGMYIANVRALLSYEYMFDRIALGARLGWAFRGAPKNFSPLHVEARVHYSLRKDPFKVNFRPYLGLAFGHAPVSAASQVLLLDCVSGDDNCIATNDTARLNDYLHDPSAALERTLNAYHQGAGFFFGPSLMLIYALANDSALVFNLTAMLPDVTFSPTIGYELGL